MEDGPAAFEQKLVIRRVSNPFSIYPDPAAQEFDYSDMKYCFVTEDVDRIQFEQEYPDAYCGAGEFSGLSDKQRDEWFRFDEIRVVGADLFEICGREVCRFEESPIFDVMSVLERYRMPLKPFPVDEL